MLIVEVYKTKSNLNPSFLKQIFEKEGMSYNVRFSHKIQLRKAKKSLPGIETVRFLGKVWETLPQKLRNSYSFLISKRPIKAHKCLVCNCRICKKNLYYFRPFIINCLSNSIMLYVSNK